MKRTIALTTATALAGGTALAVAVPAQADGPERHAHGSIAGARYEISAERDDGRYEVDADLDGVRSGSTWRMVVRHDGAKVARLPRRPSPRHPRRRHLQGHDRPGRRSGHGDPDAALPLGRC